MKRYGRRVGLMAVCMAVLLCACTAGGGKEEPASTTTTTVPTTTRTTGTPTTIYAQAEPDLELSSPTGKRPDAELFERLAAICKTNKGSVSIYYKDLETGYTLTYNADKTYQAASVIKAPYVKYLLSTDVDWNEELKMTAKMGGSAHIDSQPVGTTFTVGELMEYAIRYSDNTAYYMLNQRFAFSGFTEYANALGITANRKNNLTLTLPKPRFGYLSARDVGLYCEDIAHYIDEGSDNAKQLFSWMITTVDQQQLPDAYAGKTYTIEDLKDKEKLNAAYESRREGYTIAHKYGEQNTQAYHDGAIVWRDHPYVLAILTTLPPYEEDSIHVFHDIASLVDQIQTDWYR